MKKFLLYTLASLSLSSFGAPIRINLIACGGEVVSLIGNYYDEQTNTITTPFSFVNQTIQVINLGHEGPIVRKAEPGLLEYFENVFIPGVGPAALSQAIALITEPGHDINQFDLPIVTQLINVFNYLGVPQANIDALVERCVSLSIQDPSSCPFEAERRVSVDIPVSSCDDRAVIRSGKLIKAARKVVAQRFNHEILRNQPWVLEKLAGYQIPVKTVTYSPDGQHVASGLLDNTAHIWNVVTGECEHVLEGHQDNVTAVAYSPDGQHIATGSRDNTARIWNAATGICERELEGHQSTVTSVAYSPNGQHIVTGSLDNTARIWNVATGACEHVLADHQDNVTAVAYSPDGQHIVTGSDDHTARIWNVAIGVCECVLRGYQKAVYSVAYSPDGQDIVTGLWDGGARIWHQEWNWPNWPVNDRYDQLVDYEGNLLKQLLMLKVLSGQQLTPAGVESLRPLYKQLPESARVWVDARTNGALR